MENLTEEESPGYSWGFSRCGGTEELPRRKGSGRSTSYSRFAYRSGGEESRRVASSEVPST